VARFRVCLVAVAAQPVIVAVHIAHITGIDVSVADETVLVIPLARSYCLSAFGFARRLSEDSSAGYSALERVCGLEYDSTPVVLGVQDSRYVPKLPIAIDPRQSGSDNPLRRTLWIQRVKLGPTRFAIQRLEIANQLRVR
jgi:hypothetical protein